MADLLNFYDQPCELATAWGHHRIYAPQAYARIRTASTLPIIIHEAMALAQWYPICWQRGNSGLVLVALMHLLPEEKCHAANILGGLPLIAQAYPYVVSDPLAIESEKLIVDKTIADKPTDIGAPLILDTGRLSKASLVRARTAIQMNRLMPETLDLTQNLEEAGFLEPWPLNFDLEQGHRVERDDLYVLSAKKLGDPILYALVEAYGADAGLFLALSRISLFRIMDLLASAKSIILKDAKATGTTAFQEAVSP